MIQTSVIGEAASSASTGSGMSVVVNAWACFGQDAAHIQGHVADADRRRAGDPGQRLGPGVGVAAVPFDELASRAAPGKVLPGDSHGQVAWRADGVHHRVISLQQFLAGDVAAELHQPGEADPRRLQHLGQRIGDRLDAGVVRGHVEES